MSEPKEVYTVKLNKFDALTEALDRESFEWLESQAPDILAGIETAVGRAAHPSEIKRHVLAQTSRLELAKRCEQAARHIARSQVGETRSSFDDIFGKRGLRLA